MNKQLLGYGIAVFIALSSSITYAESLAHCSEYTRLGIPGTEGQQLCRKGYALSYDSEHKTPFWVAEHLTEEKVSAIMPRSNDFRADPDLDVGDRAELSDYSKSGYDRGHMAPAADMRWDAQAMSESFYLSNMSPQIGIGMNRGIWKKLEADVRDWAQERGELYVYTGPINPHGTPIKTIGANKVGVPPAFYKIIYDPIRVEAIAFIVPNKKLRTSELPNFIKSVRQVEKETGLNFLSTINKPIQDMVEAQPASHMWGQ